MKNIKVALLVMLMSMAWVSKGQDAEITDEELQKYAIVMDSVEVMKENVKNVISEMVASNEDMTGTRYNELSKIIDDADKLAAAEATEAEIEFIKSVKAKGDELTQEINTTFKTLAVDFIGEGGRTYKKISAALKTDDTVKSRYKTIQSQLANNGDSEASAGTN